MRNQALQILLIIVVLTPALYTHTGAGTNTPTPSLITPSVLSGDFTWNPSFLLAGGNISFTPSASGGVAPYNFTWNFGDLKTGQSNSTFNIGRISQVYMVAGNYTVTLTIKDSSSNTFSVSHVINVRGTPLVFDGWKVNWNISAHHGIEIYNVTYNTIPTIRDGILAGILVRYKDIPPSPYPLSFCLFYDQLDFDDLNTTVAGFSLQFGAAGTDPYFQIRANYNPAQVGYNYTEIWRFYTSGRFDAELAVSHLGCGRDHIYEPHWRIALTVGSQPDDLMSQYTTGGVWQNLVWEGNYTDNGARDPNNHGAQWRIGDGTSWYYMTPTANVWASDLPYIPPKIYLVRDHPNEIEKTTDPSNSSIDPIIYANGELAYRQPLAFWFLPDYWDHWLGLGRTFSFPETDVTLSFYPYNI